MNFFKRLEDRYSRYAIRNLSLIMIILYIIGYVIELFMPDIIYYLYLSPYLILHGQIWRLISWIIIPPYSLSVWIIITLYFYYSIGTTLERTWGAFKFNVYIFSGIIFTLIAAFALYFITGMESYSFSTYYICMSIFLAFAVTYPDMEVLLMMIIPIKMKWLGVAYGVMIIVTMIQGSWVTRVSIFASLLNFVIYFLITRDLYRFTPHEIRRRNKFKRGTKQINPNNANGARHKCTICGRTEKDDPNLEFRFCSKCDGNYEYCQDHLFTHTHIKSGKKL